MKRIKKILKKHPIITIVFYIIFLFFIPPLIVHVIYKTPAFNQYLEYIIPPGNMLAYIGSVLTFCATFSLSLLVFYSNKKSALKSKLAVNKVYISIDENRIVKVDVAESFYKNNCITIEFGMNIRVLSNTMVADIFLNSIELKDETASWGSITSGFTIDSPEKIVHFRYEGKNSISAIFSIPNVEKKTIEYFLNKRNIAMSLNTIFVCEDVLTPIKINLVMERVSEHLYRIESCHAQHFSAEPKKK